MRGCRSIKEAGGLVLVQDLETARFDGMPRSVISTGLADFVVSPDKMPEKLLGYGKHPQTERTNILSSLLSDEEGLARIFAILRDKHKIDFTYYKSATLVRRIHRRMNILQIPELRDYVYYLERYTREITNLYKELLIGVTSFFRDKEAFDELGNALADSLVKTSDQTFRVWVAGCSTGEEAYTISILCHEIMEKIKKMVDIKIFATDIDNEALLKAGAGIYPESIAADIEPELLQKYFYHKDNNYQVSRVIREDVVFAQQNLIKDPPFTKIDLISCRNLLIYLQPILQKKVFELFNFSLNADGLLLLGTSETIGEMADMYEPLHHKWKIYKSKGKKIRADFQKPPAIKTNVYFPNLTGRALKRYEDEKLMDIFLESLSGDYLPLSLIVNESMEVLHIFGDSSNLFKLPTGKMVNDLAKMTVKEFSTPLVTALQRAIKNKEEVIYKNIRVFHNNENRNMSLRIKPLKGKKTIDNLYAIFIEESKKYDCPEVTEIMVYDVDRETQQRMTDLEQELQYTKESLQATIEELETSNEELQATNEELLASNEELQSTNEELQSVNEELFTVNSEYQKKIIELTQLNNDIENLLSNINVATLFLDDEFNIRRFTPKLKDIFTIIDNDLGRPIHHINHIFKDFNFIEAMQKVKKFNVPTEIEVQTTNNQWFLMRTTPYMIAPEKFDGIIVTFIDISKLKDYEHDSIKLNFAEKEIAIRDEAWNLTVDVLPDMIAVLDKDYRFINVNKTFANKFGKEKKDFIGQSCCKILHDLDSKPDFCPCGEGVISGKPIIQKTYIKSLDKEYASIHIPFSTDMNDKNDIFERSVLILRDIS